MPNLAPIRHAIARILRPLPFYPKLRRLIRMPWDGVKFESSEQYWQERYSRGGNSGEGSYGALADYKAKFINDFASEKNIGSAIEFGCGDGNQLQKFAFDRYIGIDVSSKCIDAAREKFSRPGWSFHTVAEYEREPLTSELGLSLDVIYHLTEDETYHAYLDRLFAAASDYVLVYTSNFVYFDPAVPHVRHRALIDDVQARIEGWKFVETFDNPFGRPHDDRSTYGSWADFHLFERSK